jgi:hypothetical protein
MTLLPELLTIHLGASGTFWLYGSVCLVGAAFTTLWVPETRKRTMFNFFFSHFSLTFLTFLQQLAFHRSY